MAHAAVDPRRPGWRGAVGGSAGLLLLALVVAVAWRHSDVRRFAELVQRARPAWLLVAAALQAATYLCSGAIWWLVLRKEHAPQPLRRLVLLSVAKLFTDQAVPSGGVTGTLVLVRAVVRRGTPVGVAAAALVVNLLGFYAAFVLAAIASLLQVWMHREANVVFVAMTALLFVLALAVPSSLLLFLRGNRSRVVRWLGRFAPLKALLDAFAQAPQQRIRDPACLAASFCLQLGTIALDAATLYATLAAVGEPVHAESAFASFVFAMIAEVIGIAPGGLGTFEATCVALLHVSGVPIEPALAATLLLRGLTFWIPMVPGMWLVQRELV